MMMSGMMGGMIGGVILFSLLLLGFAYIVWIFAIKEKGHLKTIGKIISILIVVLSLCILLVCLFSSGMMM